jgi:hypothetical protein
MDILCRWSLLLRQAGVTGADKVKSFEPQRSRRKAAEGAEKNVAKWGTHIVGPMQRFRIGC